MPTDATPQRAGPCCHDSPRQGHQRLREQPFLCAPYVAGEDGRHLPSGTILQCPLAEGEEHCELKKCGFRNRKTGPEIPLRMLYCASHGRHFRVYPPGYGPYQRTCLAAVDLQGEALERELPEAEASCRGSLLRSGFGSGPGPPMGTRAGRR